MGPYCTVDQTAPVIVSVRGQHILSRPAGCTHTPEHHESGGHPVLLPLRASFANGARRARTAKDSLIVALSIVYDDFRFILK